MKRSDLGFGVRDLGSRVWGLGFGVRKSLPLDGRVQQRVRRWRIRLGGKVGVVVPPAATPLSFARPISPIGPIRPIRPIRLALFPLAALVLAGCHTDMWVQPKVRPFQQDEAFSDTRSARDPVPGTVARGKARIGKSFFTGYDESGKLVDKLPDELTLNDEKLSTKKDMAKVLTWGRERFTAFCSECHGAVGDGKGMITQRGLILRRSPANYHTDRLRAMPLGHFYDVQTNGFGIMNSSASRVTPDERWAIAAYIRALQLSKHAKPSDLTPEQASTLEKGGKQ
jgi:mono/diheme cytochrome c family protein